MIHASSNNQARIIGGMRLANKKENGKLAVSLVTFSANAGQLIARLPPNASRGSNGSEAVSLDSFCALIVCCSFDR